MADLIELNGGYDMMTDVMLKTGEMYIGCEASVSYRGTYLQSWELLLMSEEQARQLKTALTEELERLDAHRRKAHARIALAKWNREATQ